MNCLNNNILLKCIYSEQKRIRLIQYYNTKEVIYHLLSMIENQENMKSEYYLFCDEKTRIQDLQLFLDRYKYLCGKEERNFFVILNSPQINEHINLLVNLQNDQAYTNHLYLLVHKDYYDEKLSCISQNSIVDISQDDISKLQKSPQIQKLKEKAIFYCSDQPGSGKTNSIWKESQKYKKGIIRIPTNGDGDKQRFTEQIIANTGKNKDKMRVYHIDLYENQNIDLNFLLFEIIVLKSVNYCSKRYLDLGNQSVFLIEVNNTLRKALESQLFIKDYFQTRKVEFNINHLCLDSLNRDHNSKALTVYRYLRGLNQPLQNNNEDLYFDLENNIIAMESIEQIDIQEFSQLLNNFIVQHLHQNQIIPNFWQINNFISLFGNEMQKMKQSIYLRIDMVERAQLRKGLRTTIIRKSLDLCRKVSISCIQNTFVDNKDISNEELLTRKADSLVQFTSFVQDFVTFQEQEEACITSFFQNDQTTPQSVKDLYAQNQQHLLLFDQEQKPEILIHWLMMLCNKNIQNLYSDNKKIGFEYILDPTLKSEVNKIIIQKDNFFKIAMIFLRIRSNTPVIIMGEAGIGKTALIRLLSLIMEANFKTKIIHAGVSEEEVVSFIQEREMELQNSINKKTVLFFDEVNTNKLVSGLFKEIIVDRHLKGKRLNENIIPIAALNPYKLKSQQQQEIMQIQIHGGIKKDLIKKIQGSDLEYTVNPIPESMYSFSWNYGGLKEKDEKIYITQILIQMNQDLFLTSTQKYNDDLVKTTLSELVFFSQQYLRQIMGRISACSLRDVKRFVTILKNNIDFLTVCTQLKKEALNIEISQINDLAIYLSFYINYCARIPLNEKRREYLLELTKKFTKFSNLEMKGLFEKVEKFLINQIDVPLGIAKNYSLRQNSFILFICIINRIPVCLIGPPGSSKTLSLRQLIQSMQGINSRSQLFTEYPALMPLYYQGHVQSTSERIMEVFDNASKKQEAYNSNQLENKNLSLVYIDEIGLAEISPHNPLKVLHATLEKPDIAVACISNWPLDASKMNRMLTVYRMDINIQQLEETFESIFDEIKSQQKDPFVKIALDKSLLIQTDIKRIISNIYINYLSDLKKFDSKFEQFHGPRDFFSASKLICSEEINYIKNQNKQDNYQSFGIKQLHDRIARAYFRHFSGLEQTYFLLIEQFTKQLNCLDYNFLPTELITQNLNEEPEFFISRHLMIITDDIQNSMQFLKQKLNKRKHQFFLGSDFVEDTQMQACYNVINKIVSCIEQGMVVILQNLDNIYQSLYEVLNQSYRYYNGKYFCKISFGAESSCIEVDQNFKLILLVNKSQVHRMDGPLLNRFEKHLLNDNMILNQDDSQNINAILKDIQNFIRCGVYEQQHPFFRFTNYDSVIQNFYLQYKLQKEVHSRDQQNKMSSIDQRNLMKRIFHLIDFYQAFISSNQTQQIFKDCKQSYLNSGYHYSLNDFISNRIYSPDNEHLISEWNYFQREQQTQECQIRSFAIFSPQTFIPDEATKGYETIVLSQIPSEQMLIKQISNFLNKGLPQVLPRQQIVYSTIQNQKDIGGDVHNNLKVQSMMRMHHQIKLEQEILIIVADMSRTGKDSFDRIIFTMQKIDESIGSYLDTIQKSYSQHQQIQYTTQPNIILLMKVDEVFNMVPIGGRWEFYYIENLSPFIQFKNDSQNLKDIEMLDMIKNTLSMKNLKKNREIQICNIVKFEQLTLFYLTNDEQIFSHAYRDIKYEINEGKSEYEYKAARLQDIIKIFKIKSFFDRAYPLISEMTLYTMKNKYNVETLNDLIFNYLMPRGLSVQSSSLHTSIMNGLKEMVEKSLKMLIYYLEKEGLVYGMANCNQKQFQEYSINQLKTLDKLYSNWQDVHFKPLPMAKNLLINESENIYKQLQSYQPHVEALKEKTFVEVNQFFEIICQTARQNLNSRKLSMFSDQILFDMQTFTHPQLDSDAIQIAKAILLISQQPNQLNHEGFNDNLKVLNNSNEGYTINQINLKRYKYSTDYVIHLLLVLNIMKDQIDDLKYFLKSYSNYIRLNRITDEFIKNNSNSEIELSESIDLFKEWAVVQIYDSIKPMSQMVQQKLLLNKNYPSLSTPFIQFLEKNSDIKRQEYKDQIILVNLICEEFSDLLSKKNLLANLNFDKLINLDFKELQEMKIHFYTFYINQQENIQDMASSIRGNIQITYDKVFLAKWNRFIKQLVITSTEKGYYYNFDIQFIKIIFEIELDEIQINNFVSNQFKLFLNRIFSLISKRLTLENTQNIFNIKSEEMFADNDGNQYHTEFYTFVVFGQTIQHTIYKHLLEKCVDQGVGYLFILVGYKFDNLTTIQKVIYMSIFREFVIQTIYANNLSDSILIQRINLPSIMEEEIDDINSTKSNPINQQKMLEDINKFDQSIQLFFNDLKFEPLQIFIAKLMKYSGKRINNFLNVSFYYKNCKWLDKFTHITYDSIFQRNENEEFIKQEYFVYSQMRNKQCLVEAMMNKSINQSANVFNQIYNGVINLNQYYPFNMVDTIQSQVDLYTLRDGDQHQSLYQCFICKNYFLSTSNQYNQLQSSNNQKSNCTQCGNILNMNNANHAILIQQDLSNKAQLQQIIQKVKGFCLKISKDNPDLSIQNTKPEILRIFSIIYHSAISLSLKNNNNNNNPLLQTSKIEYQEYSQESGNIESQQYDILLVNKILKLPINANPVLYLKEQIEIAFDQFISFCQEKLQYNEITAIHLVNTLIQRLLVHPQDSLDQINQSRIISQQVDMIIQQFDNDYKNQSFAQMNEDFTFINFTSPQMYYNYFSKSLRVLQKKLNPSYTILQLQYNISIKQQYPILCKFLSTDLLTLLSKCLNNFIKFYQKTMLYFSNQFEQNKLNQITLSEALQKIEQDNSDPLYEFFVTEFIPSWNAVILLFLIYNNYPILTNFYIKLKLLTSGFLDFDISNIQEISENTRLIDLIFVKNGNTNFFQLISFLCRVQNKYIQDVLDYCTQNVNQPSQLLNLHRIMQLQYIDNNNAQKNKTLQEIDSHENTIKEPSLDIIDQFTCYGLDERDGAFENIISDLPNLQNQIVKQILSNTCLIDLDKSLSFQFLPSPKEIISSNQMLITQESIQKGVVDDLRLILDNKDLSYETLQKMVTVFSFFKSSPKQQAETSLFAAMKQLNLRSNVKRLQIIFENHLKLKHLQSFIQLLEELNMNNLVQLCHNTYKVGNNIEYIEYLIGHVWQDINSTRLLKTIIGRFIIRFLSTEIETIDPNQLLLNIIDPFNLNLKKEQEFFNRYTETKLFSSLRVCDCFLLYERIAFYLNNLDNPSKLNITEQRQKECLFIEEFTDDSSNKNIKQLTQKNQEQ